MTAEKPNANSSDVVDPDWAWAEYQPDAGRPWTLSKVGHLFRRAAFGARWDTLQRAVKDGLRRSIDQLIRPQEDVAAFESMMRADEQEVARTSGVDSLRAWWLRRILASPYPLQEKMTLFWHSHFGVSNRGVDDSLLMLRHVGLLRKHALGSYRALLAAVAADPAVLLSVGAERSRKIQPNENFIRQLMERYSVGPGHYGDEDVREAARAFTGWSVLRGRLRFLAHEHDSGSKRVLGNQGDWEAKDIVRIVLDQPATPRMIAGKLYRWFVSEVGEPSDELLAPLARMLAGEYEVGEVVETILRSNLFFSEAAYRRRVKSPVQYGTELAMGLEGNAATQPMGEALAALGEDLYNPPTHNGWVGGTHWINAATILGREKLAKAMLAVKGPYEGNFDVVAMAMRHDCATPRDAAELLLKLYLQDDVPSAVRNALLKAAPAGSVAESADWLRSFVYRVVTLPEFQLS